MEFMLKMKSKSIACMKSMQNIEIGTTNSHLKFKSQIRNLYRPIRIPCWRL